MDTDHSSLTQASVEAKHTSIAFRSRQTAVGEVDVLGQPVIALHIPFPHIRLSSSCIPLPSDES